MKSIEIEPPVYVMLTLLGISGYKMTINNYDVTDIFDRDSLVIPEIILESFADVPNQMKPALDIIWNSVGINESIG